jgi:hypothetical protein
MKTILHALAIVAGIAAPALADALPTARASITLHLHAAPDRAFPMFDPVNESLWAPDWRPTLLGDGRVAEGLVFTTDEQNDRATWLLDRYDRKLGTIRYIIVRTSTLTTIDIIVVPDAGNSIATVTYTRTALDSTAVDAVSEFPHHFSTQGPHWETAINAALDAGKDR